MAQTEALTPAIAVIGGGNGTYSLLRSLVEAGLAENTTAVLTVFDDGGSTGKLREADPTLLAPGDIRRALAALALDQGAAAEFNRRQEDGHVVGNLVLASLTRELGSFDLAIEAASKDMDVVGRVLPASREVATLVLDDSGRRVVGEHTIGNIEIVDPRARVFLEPPVEAHPEAVQAILDADIAIIAPGSLYTSIGAALAPRGMREALAKAPILVAVANLEAEAGQTPNGVHVADHVQVLEDMLGRQVDYVFHHAGSLPNGTEPLRTDAAGFEAIGAEVIGLPMATIREADGRVVHDARAVAQALSSLFMPQPQYQQQYA